LKAEKATAQAALGDLPTGDASDDDELLDALEQLPDLSARLQDADASTKRLIYDAFDLRVIYDKIEGRVKITATLPERVADLLDGAVAPEEIAGAGFEPATFGL
jgi:hypothetical protein